MFRAVVLALALALSVSQVAATVEYQWFSDYACQHPVNGACVSNAPNECCTPPYPPGINSVYVSTNDNTGAISWTMNSNANCHSPVRAIQRTSGAIAGTGCFNAANAAVGSILSGEDE